MSLSQSNILKGIAIVMMLFHHCFYSASTIEGLNVSFAPFTESQVVFVCSAFKVCVSVFVFVTGYGIARKMQGSSSAPSPFDPLVVKRLAKMMVPFYVVYVVSFVGCLALSPFFDPGRPPSEVYGELRPAAVLYALLDFLGLSYAFGTPMLNETWWYMSVALALVFVTPFVGWAMKRFGATIVLGCAFFASLCLDPTAAGMLGKVGWYLFSLVLGCWCAMTDFFERVDEHLSGVAPRMVVAAVAIVLFCALAIARSIAGSRLYWLTEGLMVLSLATAVVAMGPLKSNVLRPVAFLGIHSMDIYLIHTFFRKYFLTEFIYSAHYFVLIGLLLLAVSLLGSLLLGLVRRLIREPKVIGAYERALCRLVALPSRTGARHGKVSA